MSQIQNWSPDEILEAPPTLVHNMTPEQVTEYVKRCSVLRSSAQTRKAALKTEGGVKKKSPAKKSSVEQALELLSQIKKAS